MSHLKKLPFLLILATATANIGFIGSCSKNNNNKQVDSAKIAEDDTDLGKLPIEEFRLLPPPQVPPPITRVKPARVKINLEVREQIGRLADGVDYTFWTFGGTVPGPLIRIREGDYVDFTLSNHPDSKVPHNIDLHAVTGPGGGAEGSFTAPGHASTFSFRALNPGLYIYHCATAPVGMHIANGMYGLILVEPANGLPKVDKEFYVVQGDFYTRKKFGERGLQAFDMEKAIKEQPEYVVFNGSVGSLTEKNALKANLGETVRIFAGNGGPNLTSSFHLIGEIFDHVYQEGGTILTQKNVQTTVIPPGGAAIVDFRIDAPGNYILVDHAIFRAFNKGAIGMLKVDGEVKSRIYTGKTKDTVYLAEGQNLVPISQDQKPTAPAGDTLEARLKSGEIVYKQNCMACHQAAGEGVPNAFPPLAKSDYMMADKQRSIRVILEGLQGEITVNGAKYNSAMPAMALSDDDVASVLTYVRNSFGNKGDMVTIADVQKERKK